jgi:hypothetical protein
MSKVVLYDIGCDGPGDGRRCVVAGRARVEALSSTVEVARIFGAAKGWKRRRKADICPECQHVNRALDL